MSNLIPPEQPRPEGPKRGLLVPLAANQITSAHTNLLRNNALTLIAPKVLIVDVARMDLENDPNIPGSAYGYDKKSVFGTPVFDVIVLNALTYTNFEGKEVSLSNFTLDIAIVEVDQDKIIIRTPITGRNGRVKEYMSDDDYNIKITGSLINQYANIPPEELIRSLNAFCKAETEIKVNSTVMYYLDIFTIVIARVKFIQRKGERNAFDYELYCYSETPFEIKQSDGQNDTFNVTATS